MSGQGSSSSSSPTVPFTAEAALAHIAQLEAQLATTNSQLANANTDGRRIVALLDAERDKVKSHQQQQSVGVAPAVNAATVVTAAAAAINRVKVPIVAPFKGEIGFSVDTW